MKDNLSPEEKLLRLIKGQKKPEADTAGAKPPLITEAQVKSQARNPLYAAPKKYFSAVYLHRIIIAAFILSGFYLAASLIYPLAGLEKINLPSEPPENKTAQNTEVKLEKKPFEFYEQGVRGRQIFASESSASVSEKPLSAAGADLLKDINVVGIISGANPQVVIEDKKAQKTYYVSKGQFVGDLQIEDIAEGKIIVNYKGQKYELYM